MQLRSLLLGLLVVSTGSVALAGDTDVAKLVSRDAVSLGWHLAIISPPDPCTPPDPCKDLANLAITADERTDLDQQVVVRHHDAGGVINPCIRVLHRFLADGQMVEQIHLLDPDDAVHITTPPGYALVENRDGSYRLAKRVTDVP